MKGAPISAAPPLIGVSSCLLGQPVRYDGRHQHQAYITDTLGSVCELLPICPELEAGMGVPRPPIQLVQTPKGTRALGVADPRMDVSTSLRKVARTYQQDLTRACGYIFKSRSPSCGVTDTPVFGTDGEIQSKGSGLHAAAIQQAWPLLPLIDENALADTDLRDNFLERVFTYQRWQQLRSSRLSAKALVEFHTRHKLNLMAHGAQAARALGRMIATAGEGPLTDLAQVYVDHLMRTLSHAATPRRHANVLEHILGYLKRELEPADKQELLYLIHAYRRGELPRAAPLALLRHHIRRTPDPYLQQQWYLYPDFAERVLRRDY